MKDSLAFALFGFGLFALFSCGSEDLTETSTDLTQDEEFAFLDADASSCPWKISNSSKRTEAGGGFLYKPVSESTGKLVILIPSSYSLVPLYLVSNSGKTLERGRLRSDKPRSNGNRPTYWFSKTGSAYPNNLKVCTGSAPQPQPTPAPNPQPQPAPQPAPDSDPAPAPNAPSQDDVPACFAWDWSNPSQPKACPPGLYNCDCDGHCGSTESCGNSEPTPPRMPPAQPDPQNPPAQNDRPACYFWDWDDPRNPVICETGTYNCDCAGHCGSSTSCQ